MVPSPDPLARVCDAALTCIARVGVTKTTVDDVAREAGLSRATLYRVCGGKPALVRAVVERELGRLGAQLRAETDGAEDLADALTRMLVCVARTLRDSPALATVLAVEPEVVLPVLTFEAGDAAIETGGALFAPALARWLDPDRAARAGEWLTRILLSHLCNPGSAPRLEDPESVAAFVASFVVPAYAVDASH